MLVGINTVEHIMAILIPPPKLVFSGPGLTERFLDDKESILYNPQKQALINLMDWFANDHKLECT